MISVDTWVTGTEGMITADATQVKPLKTFIVYTRASFFSVDTYGSVSSAIWCSLWRVSPLQPFFSVSSKAEGREYCALSIRRPLLLLRDLLAMRLTATSLIHSVY